jgi:hypothetical protein
MTSNRVSNLSNLSNLSLHTGWTVKTQYLCGFAVGCPTCPTSLTCARVHTRAPPHTPPRPRTPPYLRTRAREPVGQVGQ